MVYRYRDGIVSGVGWFGFAYDTCLLAYNTAVRIPVPG